MATKHCVQRWIDEANALQGKGRQGLPLINQMMEDAISSDAVVSINEVGPWMTDQELEVYASLVMKEGGFVAVQDPGSNQTPEEFVDEVFGHDEEYAKMYGIEKGITAEDAIIKVLQENESWGEFVGMVLGAFTSHGWSDAFRERLRPVLMQTIAWQNENGVDH